MTDPNPNAPVSTPLSPAAQAVKNAVLALYSDENVQKFGWQLDAPTVAAALRAASDRMMDLIGDIYHPKYLEGVKASSDLLDQIATELRTKS
jgi:hypothetical protein